MKNSWRSTYIVARYYALYTSILVCCVCVSFYFLIVFYLYFILFYFSHCIFFSISIGFWTMNDDIIRIYFSLVQSVFFFISSKIWLLYRLFDFVSKRRRKNKRSGWKKYKRCVSCVRGYTYLFFSYLKAMYTYTYSYSALHFGGRGGDKIWSEKKENKFLSQLFGDFLFIRPYISFCLYIL